MSSIEDFKIGNLMRAIETIFCFPHENFTPLNFYLIEKNDLFLVVNVTTVDMVYADLYFYSFRYFKVVHTWVDLTEEWDVHCQVLS